MAANFFSNNDPNLPEINNKLPRIRVKTGAPKINLEGDNLFFDIDGQNVLMDSIADSVGNLFFGD